MVEVYVSIDISHHSECLAATYICLLLPVLHCCSCTLQCGWGMYFGGQQQPGLQHTFLEQTARNYDEKGARLGRVVGYK